MNCVHYVIYWAKGMAFVYDILGELGSVVRVFVVIVMLVEPHAEGSAGLTDIFLVARETYKLVYSIFIIFVQFFSFFFTYLQVCRSCCW